MLPYYLLIFVPFFIEILLVCWNRTDVYCFGHCKRNNIPLIAFFAMWCIMLALRDVSCGVDLRNYESYFYFVQKETFADIWAHYPIEQGYYLFGKFISLFTVNFQIYLAIVALLCTGVIGFFYYKESVYPLLTILLFVTNAMFPMFYSGLRQSLAMLFVVPAYYFTKNKKILLFILTIFLAQFFHSSAVIMLFLYPVFHLPLRSRYFILVMGVVAIFMMFNSTIFLDVLPLLGERYMDRYGEVEITGGYGILALLILFLVYSFIIPNERKLDKVTLGMRNVLVLCCLMQCFAPINNIAMRMNYYFLLLIPLLIPRIMLCAKNECLDIVQYSKWIMVVFFAFYFFYNAYNGSDILQIYPYVPFWKE